MTTPLTPGQRLATKAAAAAEVRSYQTDPDVVAYQVERIRLVVDLLMWNAIVIGLTFTAVNVQRFAADTIDAPAGSLGWWAAWGLDPTVGAALLGILIAERTVAVGQIQLERIAHRAKWGLLLTTYVMNTWQSWAVLFSGGSPAGVVLHSVPPLVVFLAAEVVPGLHDRLTQFVYRAHSLAHERRARLTDSESATSALPSTLPPSVPDPDPLLLGFGPDPLWRPAVDPDPDPDPISQAHPNGPGSGPGSGSGPGKTGSGALANITDPCLTDDLPEQRVSLDGETGPGPVGPSDSDDELLDLIRAEAVRSGQAPTRNGIKRAHNIGAPRASRLLARFVETGPGPADPDPLPSEPAYQPDSGLVLNGTRR